MSELEKVPSGIEGFDEVTEGGLPAGRCSLVCGGPGCGKTLFAAEFVLRGALQYDEPGVFVSFEERSEELAQNVASLGFDLPALVRDKRLLVEEIFLDRTEIEEAGDYDLEGLFLRLDSAINEVGAKRVALDTIENLFGAFTNHGILRSELNRLLRWFKERGVTVVLTGERGSQSLTRDGLEEYVSDCVIALDHRIQREISTRRLRIVKYRGSPHGTNEYPFVIGERGFSVLPVTSVGLDHEVSSERISTGIEGLDALLGGSGLYRGSSTLIAGTAGTGKTTFAGSILAAACERGERALYFSFEESPQQLLRNFGTVGTNLGPYVDAGLLAIHSARPTLLGIEAHLVAINQRIREFDPQLVVVDPMSNLVRAGSPGDATSMLLRLLDDLKGRQITAVMTHLSAAGEQGEHTAEAVSSLMDCWILLRASEEDRLRRRDCYVLKSRGMSHSNEVQGYSLTGSGILFESSRGGEGAEVPA